MPVADRRDVVDHVDVRAGVGVDEVVPPAALNLHGLGVVVLLHAGERGVPASQQFVGIRPRGCGLDAEER